MSNAFPFSFGGLYTTWSFSVPRRYQQDIGLAYIEPKLGKALVATLETAIANGKTEWQEVDDFVLSQTMDMYEFENDNAVYDHAYGTFDLMFDLVGDTDAKDVDAIASSTTFVKVE